MTGEDVTEMAHNHLLAYCCLASEDYQLPDHIVQIAHILERVERGELKRVIITIPPRHGKSMLCSQFFPAWFMGRNPEKYIITSTYGQDLSDDFGRKVRDQIEDHKFQATFPKSILRRDSRASGRFQTVLGGTYFGVGVGGPITGRGAHLLLIDDPIKNREEADSETYRSKLIAWYKAVAYTRLMKDGAVVIIMTRWHEADLIGHVTEHDKHEDWFRVDLQAIDDETGEPLWPDAYSLEDLQNIRQTLGEYDWQCLYQQNPIPREGIIFKAEWLPSGLHPLENYATRFVAVDLAISESDYADETAITVMGIPYTDRGMLPTFDEIETVHGHFEFHEQIKMIEEIYKKHKPVAIGVESVAYQKAMCQELARRGIPVIEIKADRDKVRRAMSVSDVFSQGRVRINNPKSRRQLLSFRGKGEKNDLADAIIHCVALIKRCSEETYLKPDDVGRIKTYDERVQAWQEKRRKRLARMQKGGGVDPTLGGRW